VREAKRGKGRDRFTGRTSENACLEFFWQGKKAILARGLSCVKTKGQVHIDRWLETRLPVLCTG
jgi:hypothetical protein